MFIHHKGSIIILLLLLLRGICLQCFDTVGWVSGRASPCKKIEWWGAGMVIWQDRVANDLHIFQLMPLPTHHLLLH